jgi:hypothetical protein
MTRNELRVILLIFLISAIVVGCTQMGIGTGLVRGSLIFAARPFQNGTSLSFYYLEGRGISDWHNQATATQMTLTAQVTGTAVVTLGTHDGRELFRETISGTLSQTISGDFGPGIYRLEVRGSGLRNGRFTVSMR